MVNGKTKSRQNGYALLLMLASLLGIGGVVATSFTQDARHKAEEARYLHNQRVLREAKQALLQYTYNYPQVHPQGPGRLPCPDTNDNGQPGAGGSLTIPICTSVGRFPWNETELNFYDARDASGERLWYAVSNNFYNLGGNVIINSDTTGTISIQDQSGGLMFDATLDESVLTDTPHQGIAAVIIAPGAIIDRAGVRQDRSSVANRNDPVNYLDLFANGVDNADFINSNSNGFIMGPVENRETGVELVNDQMIIVTAAEVIEMAEKATLEAYRDAILAYLAATGGVYPWLYNYNDITYDTGSESVEDAVDRLNTYYPADDDFANELAGNLDDNGRIPSMFGNYFVETSSASAIESEMDVDIVLRIPTSGFIDDWGDPIDFVTSEPFLLTFQLGVVTDVRFEDIVDTVGSDGRLSFTVDSSQAKKWPDNGTKDIFFWDEDEKDLPRWGIWRHCPDGGDGDSVIDDCHRDSNQNPDPEGYNGSKEEILKLIFQFELPAGTFNFDFNYDNPPVIAVQPASGSQHARITATFAGADVISSLPIVSRYLWDPHYHAGSSESFYAEWTSDVQTNGLTVESVTISMRYYPELPTWLESNSWHNAIRMAYAESYRPNTNVACEDEMGADDCLKINPSYGGPRDKKSVLVIAGEHGWDDGIDGSPADGDLDYQDLKSVFDDGNHNGNTTYYGWRGNDRLLVIDEL